MDEHERRDPNERISVTRAELAAFLVQSVMLAAAMTFTAAIVLQRLLDLSRATASSVGLLIGMLCSYPTIKVLGRADGIYFSFAKWFAISLSAAGFALLAISVL